MCAFALHACMCVFVCVVELKMSDMFNNVKKTPKSFVVPVVFYFIFPLWDVSLFFNLEKITVSAHFLTLLINIRRANRYMFVK